MGLLGQGFEDPKSAAIMALAAGMQRGDFGGGLLGANQAFTQAQNNILQKQLESRRMGLLDAQMTETMAQADERRQKMLEAQRQREWLANLPSPQFAAGQSALAGGGGPTVGNAARIPAVNPMQELMFSGVKAGAIPLGDYLKNIQPKQLEFGKIDPKDYTPESVRAAAASGDYSALVPVRKMDVVNNQAVNLYDARPGTVFDIVDPNKPFNMVGGQLVPNMPLQTYERSKARDGATKVEVSSDKSYFGNVVEGLAKNDVAAIDAARSAPDRISSARRVKEVLATNPITGTGAEARLAFNKAFATAGLIDGKTVADTETLASNLASQTLDAIKTSGLGAGQGFTDKDRQFLERAKSGNIEMSAETLRRLADLNERQAIATIQRGNAVISKLRSAPQMGAAGQQLDLVQIPEAQRTAPTVVRRGKYNGRTVEQLSDGTTRYAD